MPSRRSEHPVRRPKFRADRLEDPIGHFPANTYLGDAPNFMIKSICEQAKIKMPTFFGYMLYSISILIPTFLLVMVIYLI